MIKEYNKDLGRVYSKADKFTANTLPHTQHDENFLDFLNMYLQWYYNFINNVKPHNPSDWWSIEIKLFKYNWKF